MRKTLVCLALLLAACIPASAHPWEPATTGYSPTCPFPVETVWHLPEGMTPDDFNAIQNGAFYNFDSYYYGAGGYGYGNSYPYAAPGSTQGNANCNPGYPPSANGRHYGQPGYRQPSFREQSVFGNCR